MTPFFSSAISNLTVCNVHFWIRKYSKFIFMLSHLWSILVCKIPQFLAKSYRIRQLIILFQKGDTLRLLKVYIMFFPPAGAKYPFLGSSSWTIFTTYLTNFFHCNLRFFFTKLTVFTSSLYLASTSVILSHIITELLIILAKYSAFLQLHIVVFQIIIFFTSEMFFVFLHSHQYSSLLYFWFELDFVPPNLQFTFPWRMFC